MKRAIIIALVVTGCGAIPAAIDAPPEVPDDGPPEPPCTADRLYCDNATEGTGKAVFQCNSEGTAGDMKETCTYGCTDGECFDCDPGKPVCSGEDLAMCGTNGKISEITSCMDHGCQIDRCNECRPSMPFCEGTKSIDCTMTGVRDTVTECGAAGCNMDTGTCNACVGTGSSCRGDVLTVCNNGTPTSQTTCVLGCATTPAAHCRVMVPSYGELSPSGVAQFALRVAATTPPTSARLDISNCAATGNRVVITNPTSMPIMGPPQVATVAQAPNAAICVVKFHSVVIDANAVLEIVNGTAGQPLALQSETSITINGKIVFRNTGPGRSNAPDVTVAAATAPRPAPGAGGGGNSLAGGKGGGCTMPACGTTNLPGGAGGGLVAFSPTALLGGGKGGNVLVTGNATPNGVGGAAGGALHLVALKSVVVGVTGKIDLGGLAGSGRSGNGTTADYPAGGGGAGGTLLIEAPAVTISSGGVLAANGGGGAGGCVVCNAAKTSCRHVDGQPGPPSADRAAGGQCTNGGNGGSAANGVAVPAPNGQDTAVKTYAAGGGGGGAGFIVLRTRDAARLRTTGAIISPAPQTGVVVAN